MVTWSSFCKYMKENRGSMSAASYALIRRLGCERVQERWKGGRADMPLDFSDLIQRAEKIVSAA